MYFSSDDYYDNIDRIENMQRQQFIDQIDGHDGLSDLDHFGGLNDINPRRRVTEDDEIARYRDVIDPLLKDVPDELEEFEKSEKE